MLVRYLKIQYFKAGIKIFLTYFFIFLFFPLAILIIFLRPIIHIKFGLINSMRFGRFIGSIANYSKIKRKNNKKLCFYFIGYDKPIINKQIKKMFDRKFKTFSFSILILLVEKSLKFWSRGNSYSVKAGAPWEQKDEEKVILDPPISFTNEELAYGDLQIKKLNLSKNSSFVCFHNRDSHHLDTHHKYMNWKYHDYRDFSIESLRLAAEEFTNSGFHVLRVGSDANEKLSFNNDKIIDYTFSGLRSDFLDIYLAFRSKAYFGSDSGMWNIFKLFGKPTFFINSALTQLYDLTHVSSGLFIPKHLFHLKKKKNIGLKEMFDLGMDGFARAEQFEKCNVKATSNSQQELKDFATEIVNYMNGKEIFSLEDRKLQEKFWKICFEHKNGFDEQKLKTQISPSFLRKNKYLLD